MAVLVPLSEQSCISKGFPPLHLEEEPLLEEEELLVDLATLTLQADSYIRDFTEEPLVPINLPAGLRLHREKAPSKGPTLRHSPQRLFGILNW